MFEAPAIQTPRDDWKTRVDFYPNLTVQATEPLVLLGAAA